MREKTVVVFVVALNMLNEEDHIFCNIEHAE
jgi:hypothetical protein